MSAKKWTRGWRIGAKRADTLRHLACLLTGHDWQVNNPATQRACLRCWWCQDRELTDEPQPTTTDGSTP